LATSLIRSGASLKEIADLLGHRRLETTQIYAKLDLESLREVAQPWPEVAS
jgi:site-specific recombinase XerD